MIVDTSALIAVVRAEPDAPVYAAALADAHRPLLSAANYLEAAVVVDSARDPVATRKFDRLLETAGIIVVDVTVAHARTARLAYQDFGRGSGHPARLNFGDCFAYALARAEDGVLLFKGDDFAYTDLSPALPSG